ncbi:unnamed protein product [Urochloa humidicola]
MFSGYSLEVFGGSVKEDGRTFTELDNSVSSRQEGRYGENHSNFKAMCKQTRKNILETTRLDRDLVNFLLENNQGWKTTEVPTKIMELMNKQSKEGKEDSGWLLT